MRSRDSPIGYSVDIDADFVFFEGLDRGGELVMMSMPLLSEALLALVLAVVSTPILLNACLLSLFLKGR